jgi:hypothetical protein
VCGVIVGIDTRGPFGRRDADYHGPRIVSTEYGLRLVWDQYGVSVPLCNSEMQELAVEVARALCREEAGL